MRKEISSIFDRNNQRLKAIFAIACVVLLGASLVSECMTVRRAPARVDELDQVVWMGGYIVIGDVKEIECCWEDDLIYSYVTIFVVDVERGPVDWEGEEIVVRHIGGGIDGVVLWQSDQAYFAVGETVRVHLQGELPVFTVIGGPKGKVSLDSELPPIEVCSAAGYSLTWYKPETESWNYSYERPGPDWYGPLRWDVPEEGVSYWINPAGSTGLGIPEETFINYVQKCYQTWEDDPSSTIDYMYMGTTDLTWDTSENDNVNIFCWKSLPDHPFTLGACRRFQTYTIGEYDSLRIKDSDVLLNTDALHPWSAAPTCPSDKCDVQNVGTHECGHVCGLADLYDDEDEEMTMFGYSSTGETKKRDLNWGDSAGVYVLYLRQKTAELLIHVYLNPDAENFDLEAGQLDINDWPLEKYWIDRWTGNPDIQMMGYSALDDFDLDMNNQRWPTGVTELRGYDPATGTYKHYYGTNQPWDDKAMKFRKAIAYLVDKDYIITNILMGMGVKKDVPMPASLSRYIPYADLIEHGLIYGYDPYKAAAILTEEGFVQGTTPNPYYPAEPEGWEAEKLRLDPRPPNGDLQPLEFYIRLDDPIRIAAGQLIRDTLRKSGIQVNDHIVQRADCCKKVMVEYDFHLYTGGWSLGADVDWLYWLYSAEMYWGGNLTSYSNGRPYSLNYPGFCYPDFVAEAVTILTANTSAEVTEAVKKAIIKMQEGCPVVPIWSSYGVKAHRTYDTTGTEPWTGVVNEKGYGIDNYWTFLNMYNPLDNRIDWGFKSNLESIHVITAQWLWDWNVIRLQYDTPIGLNPYTLAAGDEYGWLANSWDSGVDEKGPYVLYRMGCAWWHDGNEFHPWDYAFSLTFTRDCGPGVSWVYSSVKDVDFVEVKEMPAYAVSHPDIHVNPALGEHDVKIYFTYPSFWLLHWASISAINPHVWVAANDEFGWNYGSVQGGTLGRVWIDWDPVEGSGTNAKGVREYHPWDENVYNPGAGLVDLAEDGTGAWIYDKYVPEAGTIETATEIYLKANLDFNKGGISDYLIRAFSDLGNVNNPLAYYKNHLPDPTAPPPDYYYKHEDADNNGEVDWPIDMLISGLDLGWTLNIQGADASYPPEYWGIGWDMWNPDADLDHDGSGTYHDLIIICGNYGSVTGPPDP